MPSTTNRERPTSTIQLRPSRQDVRVAQLAALAITIHIAEAALPSPLPGIKPGLANVVTLVALLRYGLGTAAWVAVLRVLGGSLLLGTFLSPTFMLAAAGASAALLALGAGRMLPGLGPVGYGVVAALAHMGGQFLLAYIWLIPHTAVLRLLPPLLTASLIFGAISGIIAAAVIRAVPDHESSGRSGHYEHARANTRA